MTPRARPSSASSARRHRGGEADHAVVGGVDLEDHAGLGTDGADVVLEVGAVGGAHLAQHRAGAAQDVRDPELAADLDQLAARDDDFLSAGQALEREQHRGGAVVDDEGGLRAGEPPQQALDVRVARAALLPGHVHLEIRVGPRHLVQPLLREGGEQRAAEVGVQHDAGRVDHGGEREDAAPGERGHDPGAEGGRVRGGAARLQEAAPLRVQGLAHRRGQARARHAREGGLAGESPDQDVDRGQRAQQPLHVRRASALSRPRQARSPRAPSPARSPRGPRAGWPPGSPLPRASAGGGAPRPR